MEYIVKPLQKLYPRFEARVVETTILSEVRMLAIHFDEFYKEDGSIGAYGR